MVIEPGDERLSLTFNETVAVLKECSIRQHASKYRQLSVSDRVLFLEELSEKKTGVK
jgi:hypothetical protein